MNSSQMRGSPQLDQIPSFSSASRREATLEEITGFANYLGMDMETDKHLLWIAEAAVLSPVPQGWTQHETEDGFSYFHSLDTGETSWEHPTDAHFKDLFRRVKEQEQNSVKAAEIAVMSLLGSDSSVVPGETERRGPQGRALLHAVRTAVADAFGGRGAVVAFRNESLIPPTRSASLDAESLSETVCSGYVIFAGAAPF